VDDQKEGKKERQKAEEKGGQETTGYSIVPQQEQEPLGELTPG